MSTRLRSPFAFLGRSAASDDDTKEDKSKSKAKAEENDDDEDEDGKKKDKKDDDAKGKSKSKAEDGDDDDDDKKKKKPEDEDEDGNGGTSKSKKAKSKAEDDDDTSASYQAGRAAGRSFERARVRAIMVSEAGQADPVARAHVAFDTDMPRDQAIGMLAAMSVSRAASGGPMPARAGLGNRMSEVPNPTVGADGGSSTGPSMADQIVAAGKKRRGEG